jgi:peptide/nickel transport system ATP-binding protein
MVLLGAEGSGKTKLLEAIAGLAPPTSGTILLSGNDVTHAKGSRARRLRRDVQLVFQDASATLDASKSVQAHLEEAIKLAGSSESHPGEWLETLGLSPRLLNAKADQLSSSECQRVNLIRCLILRPALILFDSPEVSAADTDGGLVNAVLASEKAKGRAFLVATSDPSVADTFADRIAVLHAGRVVELGARKEVLLAPAHPVTQALIDGTPLSPAAPATPHEGCPHVNDCSRRKLPQCQVQEPMLAPLSPNANLAEEEHRGIRRVACFHPIVSSDS